MLYSYTRSRRTTALKLALNMAIVPFYLMGFFYFAGTEPDLMTLKPVVLAVAGAVELALLVIVLWFLAKPASFSLTLTPTCLEVVHPLFSEWTWSIKPQDIDRIENKLDMHGTATVWVHGRGGERHQLCPNHAVDRKKLYGLLSQLNPTITLPENPYGFSRRGRGVFGMRSQ